MLGSILSSIFKWLCGSSSSEETKPQHPQHPGQHQYPPSKPHSQLPGSYPPAHQPVQPPRPQQPSKPPKVHEPPKSQQDDAYYTNLRAKANEEGDKMAECFRKGHDAYARGDGAAAKQFSNEGKAHQANMERLNKQASDWIFQANNADKEPGEIDLHGLYVKEAIARTEQGLEAANRSGQTELKLIVGKGLHSSNGAKIKPAIETLMKKYNLQAELDPHNAGVLVVRLNQGRRGMGADEISRRIERNDEGCVVM